MKGGGLNDNQKQPFHSLLLGQSVASARRFIIFADMLCTQRCLRTGALFFVAFCKKSNFCSQSTFYIQNYSRKR